jgi:hypothetical protein
MGYAMGKDDNIYVKLVLDVHFDKNAPNFHMDSDMISWCPTVEEIGFINDSIQKISQHYWNAADATKTFTTPIAKPDFPQTTNPPPKTPTPPPTSKTSTPTTTPLPKFTPPPTDNAKTNQTAATTHDSTVDLLLKRKKGEKEQKVAFTP